MRLSLGPLLGLIHSSSWTKPPLLIEGLATRHGHCLKGHSLDNTQTTIQLAYDEGRRNIAVDRTIKVLKISTFEGFNPEKGEKDIVANEDYSYLRPVLDYLIPAH